MSEDIQLSQMQIETEKEVEASKSNPKQKTKKPKPQRFQDKGKTQNQKKRTNPFETKYDTSPKLYVVPNRVNFIPIDPQFAIIYNHPVEIKSIGGLCLELLTHFISKYTPINEQSGSNILTEFRHHLAAAVICYLRAASFTTIFPSDIANKLNYYANKSIYIDPNLIKTFNAFMPVKDAVQLNIVDVVYKCNVIFDSLQPFYESITRGTPIQGQDAIEYNNITLMTPQNPILKAIQIAHNSPAFATYMTATQIEKSPIAKIGPQYTFQTVVEVKIPTFIFDFEPSKSKYITRKEYTIVVRSKEFVTINNSDIQGVKSYSKLPPKESDVIIRVNSIYQYLQGYHINEISNAGFEHIRYQNRDVRPVSPPTVQVVESNYQGKTPQPNYEHQTTKVDTRLHSSQYVYYSDQDHGKSSTSWYRLAIPIPLMNEYLRQGRVHLSASNAIQTIDPSLDLSTVSSIKVVDSFRSQPFGVSLDDVSADRANWPTAR